MHKTKDQIIVLYVSELVQTSIPHPSPYYQNLEKQLNEELHKHAHQILDFYDQKLKEANVQHKIVELSGTSAKDMIVQFTAESDVDTLVLGRRSMGEQERKLLGSTTDYCTLSEKKTTSPFSGPEIADSCPVSFSPLYV